MNAPTLYTMWRSSAAYRVRITLGVKGLSYHSVPVRFATGEHRAPSYLAHNPQGLVPTLAIDGASLSQSLAIIEYLDETHPQPPLLPGDPRGRAQVRAMAQAVACDIHPLNNLRVLNYLKGPLAQPAAAVDRWYAHWMHAGLAPLEHWARLFSGDGRHLYGTSVTVADVCLVPQLYNARRFAVDLAPYPTLCGIDAALRALPAFDTARPERQPDAD